MHKAAIQDKVARGRCATNKCYVHVRAVQSCEVALQSTSNFLRAQVRACGACALNEAAAGQP
eukprot:scaffold296212_cov23-Tisochrysis_lutea.AAC.1